MQVPSWHLPVGHTAPAPGHSLLTVHAPPSFVPPTHGPWHWMSAEQANPRTPVPLLRITRSPREPVCAVAYSQFWWVTTSSLHCASTAALGSIAQNEVTGVLAVSFAPTS